MDQQTITLMITIVSSMAAVWYAFYHIIKADMNLIREENKKRDAEFAAITLKSDAEFAKIRNSLEAEAKETRKLWATLLEKIYDIELKIYKIEQQSLALKSQKKTH